MRDYNPTNAHQNGDAADAMDERKGDDVVNYTTSTADESSPKRTPADSNSHEADAAITYMTGLRFYLTCASLWLFFFMVTMEVSVVATALVGISGEMGGSNNVSWIMSSYLLGYVAVMIITSKFSDVFGRKSLLVLSAFVFTVFSGACGAAQSITQLIILRAFQGAGGGGCFAMNLIFITEMVPPAKLAEFAGLMSIPAIVSLGVGPVIGGAIIKTTTWRWVFLMNVPSGVVALALTIFAIPNGFPYHGSTNRRKSSIRDIFSKDTWERIDFHGSVMLFLGSLSVTAAFSEAESRFPWKSAYVITLLTVSGLIWIVFMLWERRVTLKAGRKEPVLPWRFLTDRVRVSIILGAFFLGGPMTATLFAVPQRLQIVNELSSLDAGVRLLPFAIATGCGAFGSRTASAVRFPAIYLALIGCALQIAGFAVLGTLDAELRVAPRIYGAQAMAGLGCGFTYNSLYVIIPSVTGPKDSAVGLGAATQFRMMGASVILAVATSVFNDRVLSSLKAVGVHDPQQLIAASTSSETRLPYDTMAELRTVLSEGYNRQMLIICGSAAAEALVVLLMWKQEQILFPTSKGKD